MQQYFQLNDLIDLIGFDWFDLIGFDWFDLIDLIDLIWLILLINFILKKKGRKKNWRRRRTRKKISWFFIFFSSKLNHTWHHHHFSCNCRDRSLSQHFIFIPHCVLPFYWQLVLEIDTCLVRTHQTILQAEMEVYLNNQIQQESTEYVDLKRLHKLLSRISGKAQFVIEEVRRRCHSCQITETKNCVGGLASLGDTFENFIVETSASVVNIRIFFFTCEFFFFIFWFFYFLCLDKRLISKRIWRPGKIYECVIENPRKIFRYSEKGIRKWPNFCDIIWQSELKNQLVVISFLRFWIHFFFFFTFLWKGDEKCCQSK